MSRESAEARLARLRQRLTVTLTLVAFVGVAGLAAVTTVVDGSLRADRFNTELQGRAFRSAALVFFDDTTNEWVTDGVLDDLVVEVSDGVAVVDRASGDVLLSTGEMLAAEGLLAAAFADAAEDGSLGTVTWNGERLIAAGAPYFDEETSDSGAEAGVADIAGAVIVAGRHTTDPDRRRLLAFVWSTVAVLSALSAVIAWWASGRVVRPLGEELDREEAFLATAAHELRTPLGRFRAVTESAQLTAAQLPASAERDALAGDLRRLLAINAETTKSIEDLLLLGRIEAGAVHARPERLRLDEIVAGFEATTPELAVDIDRPVEIIADATLARHAISNLITNAQKHGQRPGEPLVIEAAVTIDGHHAVVTVRDNGPGLGPDPEACFVRHHTSGVSGGLGLWIVRNIVTAGGGSVRAWDDDGAVFELRWPLASP